MEHGEAVEEARGVAERVHSAEITGKKCGKDSCVKFRATLQCRKGAACSAEEAAESAEAAMVKALVDRATEKAALSGSLAAGEMRLAGARPSEAAAAGMAAVDVYEATGADRAALAGTLAFELVRTGTSLKHAREATCAVARLGEVTRPMILKPLAARAAELAESGLNWTQARRPEPHRARSPTHW